MEFLPPQPDRFLMSTVDLLLPLWVRYRCGISSTQTINSAGLVRVAEAFLTNKARVIFAFRHPTIDDQYGLIHLFSRVLPRTARAMGEFGAVSVVSGHIRGQTNTMPLHVEVLYNEYQSVAAFAVASLLALLAIVTLVVKSVVEWRHEREIKAAAALPPERPLQLKEAV